METQSENNLDKYFDTVKQEKYRESFDEVESWLRREVSNSLEKRGTPKITFLKYIFSEGRLKFAYLFIILVLAGITSNFSVTRTEPVGIVMSWSVDKQNPEAIKKIDNFDWIDKSKLIVNEENSDGKQVLTYKFLIPSASIEEIEILKKELENTKDIYSVNLIPISEPVRQPLYAVALEKFFKVDYDKNLANADEIKSNVFEQLKLAGLQNDVDINVPASGSAGKFVNFDFGKKPDSIRIKVHSDAVKEYYIEKALEDVDKLLSPVKVINDSILKTIIIKVNGEEVNTNAILYEVQRNLDTLHLRLRNSEQNRKERIEKFNEKMERFHERMEKFNRNMEKFDKKMEKINEKMKELNVPDVDYHYEIDKDGDIDIDIDIDIEDIPEIDEKKFKFDLNLKDLDEKIKIQIDSLNIRKYFNEDKMKEMNEQIQESMKKLDMDMKKLQEDLRKNKIIIDTSDIKIYFEDDEEEGEDSEDPEIEVNMDKEIENNVKDLIMDEKQINRNNR